MATKTSKKTTEPKARPKMTDPAWTDWVIEQLHPSEKNEEGYPTIEGLRRFTDEFIGDVIFSAPVSMTVTDHKASVIYKLVVRSWEDEIERTYGGAGDSWGLFDQELGSWIGNIDKEFGNYLLATSETRAEGRTYRKMLRLKKMLTAEEKAVEATGGEATLADPMTDTQKVALKKVSRDADINVAKFIAHNDWGFTSTKQINQATAKKMMKQLSDYNRDRKSIPDEIKGFDKNWSAD